MSLETFPFPVGKYTVLERIGEGRFGAVYKARDTTLDRIVALKVLKPVLLTDPQFVTAFLAEAQKVARLNHPNVVTVYEVGEWQGTYFIAMEYLPRSLASLLAEKKRLGEIDTVQIVSQIVEGLQAAHDAGLIHCDIKPSNILLDEQGRAKLADFGLAQASRVGSTTGFSGTLSGTVEYVAPERAQNKPLEPRSDIYSLGIVAYQLLTGSTPFKGDDPMAILFKHVNELPPPMKKFGVKVSINVETAVLRAIAKKPQDRYPTAQEFANALQTATLPGAKPQPVKKPARRGMACATLALGVTLILICLVGILGAVYGNLALPIAFLQTRTVTPSIATSVLTRTGSPIPSSPTVSATVLISPSPTHTNVPEVTRASAPTTIPTILPPTVPPTRAPTLVSTSTPQTAGDIMPAFVINTGIRSNPPAGEGTLQVVVLKPNSQVSQGTYVTVYSQKQDIQGNQVRADRINGDSTDNTGTVNFNLKPGQYSVFIDLPGYNWGDSTEGKGKVNIPVTAGQTTQLIVKIGRLRIGFVRADGTTIAGQYVTVYLQQKDVAGNWVTAGRVDGDSTDNTGSVSFDLMPGRYIVAADLAGYSWGNAYDIKGEHSVTIQPAQVTSRIVTLGRIIVALKKPDGSANPGQYVTVYTQKTDVAGKPALDRHVIGENTDNAGRIVIDLTAGKYAIVYGDKTLFNVEVISGKTTVFDGNTAKLQ